MKKSITILAFFVAIYSIHAQEFKYGWKIGTSIGNNSDVGIKIDQGVNSYDLNLSRSKKDFSAGFFGTLKLNKFYIAPEVMINTFKIEYKRVGPNVGIDTLKNDRFIRIDIPFMLGYRVGKAVFLKAGPALHFHLNGKSDLTTLSGFTAKYKPFEIGYQYGAAFALNKKVQFDIRFDRYLGNYGEHIYFDSKQSTFPHKFRRMYMGLAFTL